jgi:hypothetical protein
MFISDSRIHTLRRRIEHQVEPTYAAFLQLQRECENQVAREPVVPTEWYVPGYYRNADVHILAKKGLADDANSAYSLALLYRVSGDGAYARATVRLLDGWATCVQSMSQEDDSMLSFSYHFPAFIFAADLIGDFSGWLPEQRQAFQEFLRYKALPMNTMERSNNWGNWGLVLVLAIAAHLEDRVLFEQGIERWKEFIETQLADDGHLPHEVGRNKGVGESGLWYTHFSLMPQVIAAEIARLNGVELYEYRSPGGRSLRSAFERVAPWVRDITTFPYYKGDDPQEQVGTDYVSYWEILNPRWPHADATSVLNARRPLSAMHCTPHLTFTHGDLLHDE